MHQYTLLLLRTLELFMLVNSFRRAAELKVLVLVLWHAASKEGSFLTLVLLYAARRVTLAQCDDTLRNAAVA